MKNTQFLTEVDLQTSRMGSEIMFQSQMIEVLVKENAGLKQHISALNVELKQTQEKLNGTESILRRTQEEQVQPDDAERRGNGEGVRLRGGTAQEPFDFTIHPIDGMVGNGTDYASSQGGILEGRSVEEEKSPILPVVREGFDPDDVGEELLKNLEPLRKKSSY